MTSSSSLKQGDEPGIGAAETAITDNWNLQVCKQLLGLAYELRLDNQQALGGLSKDAACGAQLNHLF
eukprot:CAMPEP_0194583246 /NCGR_PEP_ID=MMETSP0292-20121207/16195_1 /TAXON_ID=39354 /ORGANISM="Heterosigma akashiwo, Strain CCMP2393" /LENGTH=66 /DNA_ID=CAMNT_0039437771 /DNA_START=650 /DNA_END=848 /DNA_ORIENTATION=+